MSAEPTEGKTKVILQAFKKLEEATDELCISDITEDDEDEDEEEKQP